MRQLFQSASGEIVSVFALIQSQFAAQNNEEITEKRLSKGKKARFRVKRNDFEMKEIIVALSVSTNHQFWSVPHELLVTEFAVKLEVFLVKSRRDIYHHICMLKEQRISSDAVALSSDHGECRNLSLVFLDGRLKIKPLLLILSDSVKFMSHCANQRVYSNAYLIFI